MTDIMQLARGAAGLFARLAVTLGLLFLLVFVMADPEEVARRISSAAPNAIAAAVALSVLDRVMMAYKWWLLLRSGGLSVGLWLAVRAYFASSLCGLVLPVTVGADVVRIVALRHAGMERVAASIIVERGLGVIALGSVALLSCLLLSSATTDAAWQSLTTWLVAVFLVSAGLFVISLVGADRATARWMRCPLPVRRLTEAYVTYRRHAGVLVLFYGLSVIESLVPSAVVYVVAAGLNTPISVWTVAATVPLSLAVARMPVSYGGFGIQEAAFVYIAGTLGVPSNEALPVILLSDLVMLIAFLPSALDSQLLTLRRQTARTDVM